MNISSIIQHRIDGEQDDKGFTLIEILIAIVLVGILSAVAVVGISNLVSKGSTSACTATRSTQPRRHRPVYFASNNTYPTTPRAVVTGGQRTDTAHRRQHQRGASALRLRTRSERRSVRRPSVQPGT